MLGLRQRVGLVFGDVVDHAVAAMHLRGAELFLGELLLHGVRHDGGTAGQHLGAVCFVMIERCEATSRPAGKPAHRAERRADDGHRPAALSMQSTLSIGGAVQS